MSSAVPAPRVAVIIVAWNRVDELATCLESFSCVEYPNYDVIVVDNGSQDATVPTVRERFPWATLIANKENLGYVGGSNIGFQYALEHGADYVFLLNQDTKMTPDVLSQLVRVMQSDRRIAVAGARNLLMEDPTRLWGAYGVLTYGPFLVRVEGQRKPDGESWRVVKDVDSVIGNGCLYDRRALEDVGLLDDSFFAYHEDVDWCVRAYRAGYRVVYAGTVAIVHKGGSSSDPSHRHSVPARYLLGRNGVLFVRKNARCHQRAMFGLLCGAALLAWAVKAVFLQLAVGYPPARARGVESWSMLATFMRGVADGLRGRPVPFVRLGVPDSGMPPELA